MLGGQAGLSIVTNDERPNEPSSVTPYLHCIMLHKHRGENGDQASPPSAAQLPHKPVGVAVGAEDMAVEMNDST